MNYSIIRRCSTEILSWTGRVSNSKLLLTLSWSCINSYPLRVQGSNHESILAYVHIEQVRFGSRLHVEYDVEVNDSIFDSKALCKGTKVSFQIPLKKEGLTDAQSDHCG